MQSHIWTLIVLFSLTGCASMTEWGMGSRDKDIDLLHDRQEEMRMDFDQRMASMEMSLLRQEKFLRDYFDIPGVVAVDGLSRGPEPGLEDDTALPGPVDPVVSPAPSTSLAPEKTPLPEPAPKAQVRPQPRPEAVPPPRPTADTGQAFYDQALKKYYSGEYVQAREDFAAFEQRHPNSPLQPNALYWLAETHYAQKQYAQAILVFKELTRRFPASNKSPDALLKAGFAYEQLGDIPNARFHLQIVLDDHPRTAAAKLARERLATLTGS